jgi:hypothetical protein
MSFAPLLNSRLALVDGLRSESMFSSRHNALSSIPEPAEDWAAGPFRRSPLDRLADRYTVTMSRSVNEYNVSCRSA